MRRRFTSGDQHHLGQRRIRKVAVRTRARADGGATSGGFDTLAGGGDVGRAGVCVHVRSRGARRGAEVGVRCRCHCPAEAGTRGSVMFHLNLVPRYGQRPLRPGKGQERHLQNVASFVSQIAFRCGKFTAGGGGVSRSPAVCLESPTAAMAVDGNISRDLTRGPNGGTQGFYLCTYLRTFNTGARARAPYLYLQRGRADRGHHRRDVERRGGLKAAFLLHLLEDVWARLVHDVQSAKPAPPLLSSRVRALCFNHATAGRRGGGGSGVHCCFLRLLVAYPR